MSTPILVGQRYRAGSSYRPRNQADPYGRRLLRVRAGQTIVPTSAPGSVAASSFVFAARQSFVSLTKRRSRLARRIRARRAARRRPVSRLVR